MDFDQFLVPAGAVTWQQARFPHSVAEARG
jgi:hypothetical protein